MEGSEVCKVTTTPAAGAVADKVTRAQTAVPRGTVVRCSVNDVRVAAGAGSTVNVVVLVVPFAVADNVTSVEVLTGLVVIGKVADVAPASAGSMPPHLCCCHSTRRARLLQACGLAARARAGMKQFKTRSDCSIGLAPGLVANFPEGSHQ